MRSTMKAVAAIVLGLTLVWVPYAETTPSPAEYRTWTYPLARVFRPMPSARVLLTQAAEIGSAVAQIKLGDAYFDGDEGFEQDDAKAVRWYRAAAGQGSAAGQWRLGIMYAYGRGVPRDYATAVRWFRAAAEQGSDQGQWLLGIMYVNGWGVPKDNASAVPWLRLAAGQGHINAQLVLGLLYRQGAGVEQDYVAAYAWLNLAAVQNSEARQGREQLAEVMTADQIADAQRMARELWERIETGSTWSANDNSP